MVPTRSGQVTARVDESFLRSLEQRIDVAADRDSIEILAPFTEGRIGTTPQATAADVAVAVEGSRRAQTEWARVSPKERAAVLSRFHDLLLDRAEEAMDLLQLEAGKARIPAFEEVFDVAATTRYYVNTGPRLLRRRRRATSLPGFTTAWEYRHPIGVVGSIVPWNFPLTLAISDIVPALIAGNGVVIKPDEKTPYATLLGVLLLEEAGLPPGLIRVVTGAGEIVGPPLIDSVDFIAFTGSTEVGRSVARQAAGRLIGSSLELGSKNAALVLADLDLDKKIAEVARSVFANGGQLCIAMERIYVEAAVHEEFTRRFVDHARSLELSAGFDYSSPVSSQISREHLAKVASHVDDAIAKGATLLTGGKPRPDVGPLFYEPTVLTDVNESMMLCRSETFGPVVSIYPVKDVDEAVTLANDSEFGLNFSVWTGDLAKGVEVARRLKSGAVGVNDGYAAMWSSYDAPMGGVKASGLSRRHGAVGILKFTDLQTVAVQRGVPAFAPVPGMSYKRYQKMLAPWLKLVKRLPFYK